VLVADPNDRLFVVAETLLPAIEKGIGRALRGVGERVSGKSLEGLRYRHPLPPEARGELTPEEEARSFRVVLGKHVTMDAGPGLVHTAPGHGEADFLTGQRENLPILSPVDEGGRFTTAARYRGKKVLEANGDIVADLEAAGALAGIDRAFRHSY